MPAFYGAQVRGGLTVPLNADSRGPLLHAVIEHSDIQAIVVRDDLVERLTALPDLGHVRLVVVIGDGPLPSDVNGVPTIRWDEWLAGVPAHHAWPFPPHDAYCLIQYTSGTTGRPKGAVYTHHFLYLYSSLCSDSQERSEDDILTAPLPLFHVAALHIIANSSLHAGCTGHLKSRFSASQYWQQCADDGATWPSCSVPWPRWWRR
jgi:acyl-CoA synthetase (AMP-forming)/AMP-acid ligase II